MTGTTQETWRDRAGRIVLDPNGPHGEPIATPRDHRWLWRLEGELAVLANNDTLRQIAADLRAYLNETCQHHWLHCAESRWTHPDTGTVHDVLPAHRQCLWCCAVEWDGEETA